MTDTSTHAGQPTAFHIGQLAHCPDSKFAPLALGYTTNSEDLCNGCYSGPFDALIDSIKSGAIRSDRPVRDQAFDPFISLVPGKRALLIDLLLPPCDKAIGRKLGRKATDREKYGEVLASVTANALRAAYHPSSNTVRYPRGDDFSSYSFYYPDSTRVVTLRTVVDALGSLGFLALTTGKQEWVGDERVRLQSTFQATEDFVAWLDQAGLTPTDLIRLKGGRAIVLRSKWKKGVRYDASDPTVSAMAEAVHAYNTFLSKVELSLDLSESELQKMHMTPERTGKPRPPINFHDKELCRIFNNRSFDQGGRFFRGWWIGAPKQYRDHILIDGKPTIEKDYSGCFLRMMYHLKAEPFPADPYAIPEVKALADEQGLEWKAVRTAIKRLTNIYLNASHKHKIWYFPDITRDLPVGLDKPMQIYDLIKALHQPIADKFRTGYGVKLMRYESDMCAYVLAKGVREKIPVLPIHDSFRVQQNHGDWLEQAMREAYQEQFPGFSPEIE